MTSSATCRSCGAPVLWVRGAGTGSWMILDPEPTETGNVIIHMGPGPGKATASVETEAETEARLKCAVPAGRLAYVSHLATCKDAEKWRKRDAE